MRKIIYTFLLCAPLFTIAQTKKPVQKAPVKTATITTQTPEQETPKRAPGTTDAHPEAKINSPLPAFQFVTPSKTFLTEKDLPKDKPIVFALFNPTCDHCQVAFNEIRKNMERYKDASIVFVTFADNFAELDDFIKTNNGSGIPNLHVVAARSEFITNFFMPNYILPQIMTFNKQRKLKKIFYEKVQTDSLLTYLNKQ